MMSLTKSVHVPECDDQDNRSFKAQQCYEGNCWCVTNDGDKVEETDLTEALNCPELQSKQISHQYVLIMSHMTIAFAFI